MTQTPGTRIAKARKERGLTQLELAEQMGVTDKAVSKWERDLSCPDVASLPKLAGILGLSVDELIGDGKKESPFKGSGELLPLVLKSVTLAMGIAVAALTTFDRIDPKHALTLLGIGLTCVALSLLHSRTQ